MPENQNKTESKTVLVVEDEPRVRRYSCRIFASLGYHILEAENASMATDILVDCHDEINLVFSDIVMPGDNNGRDLVQHVQASYPHIEVLLTSGFEKTMSNSTQEEDNQVPVLKKPYTKEDLVSALEELPV
ncbi:MAG: response regulator [Gammaproteobacteria bacterium]|nr:response regulator [Gammaproteobacteria bacterium]MBT4377440.1 response regulator [Gammaproteobacteria bacterium]MBT5444583.1 response regulator [Gammaproteobacteria bacterium]MBT5790611.1 response regulator [Gammaproteobacteria bacterium]MBT6570915.1 response regulator [Gammaproteobacteria bacterium]